MEKLESFPDEILINILKYLNTFDLINFCESFTHFGYLLKERKLINQVNFSKGFHLQEISLLGWINAKMDPNLIHVLNINGLYWISSIELSRVLNRLENLKELHALDTKLGFSKYIPVYKKLTKLALTITESEVEAPTLWNLNSLCIKIVLTSGTFDFQQLFNDKWCLEELWISNEERVLNYEIVPYILKSLKRLVIRSRSFSPFYDFSLFGLHMVFQCSRNESEIQFMYERVPRIDRTGSLFEPFQNELEQSWEILHRHHKDVSCGPKDAKLLFVKENICDIYFEDLNFGHSIILCQEKYIEAASKVLLSKNASNLKRLHFRSCLFQRQKGKTEDNPTVSDAPFGFKRPRYEVNIRVADDPFENIAKNLKKLTELEIYFCPGCYSVELLSSYNLISCFEHLEKLTLEVPLTLNGSFLKEVLIKCEKLWSLKLTISSQNEKFTSRLCESLKFSKSLRDFTLNHVQIHIEKLLESFNEIQKKTIQRIFLKCDDIRYTNSDTELFNRFLHNNPQLVFFFLVVRKNTVKQVSNIQKIFNEHKKGNPAKIYYIKKDYSFSGYFPVPCAHHDMIYRHTDVAVINFDEF